MDAQTPRGIGRADGYTLLELMTVVALVAVVAALAYPAAAGLTRGQEVETAAVALLQDLRLAQWRAVVSGRRVRCLTARAEDGTWRYRFEREEGGAWVPEGAVRVIPQAAALSASGPAAKVFNPDGTSSSGSLALQGPGAALYRYTLTPATGRVRFYRGQQEVARAR